MGMLLSEAPKGGSQRAKMDGEGFLKWGDPKIDGL